MENDGNSPSFLVTKLVDFPANDLFFEFSEFRTSTFSQMDSKGTGQTPKSQKICRMDDRFYRTLLVLVTDISPHPSLHAKSVKNACHLNLLTRICNICTCRGTCSIAYDFSNFFGSLNTSH